MNGQIGRRNPARLRRARRAFFGTTSRIGSFLRLARTVQVTDRFRGLRWLTAAALILFALQVVSGILLALYYYPEPGVAYDSVRFLTEHVPAGWFLRSMHNWAADLLLICVLLHVISVFFRRAYVWPREYQWFIGVLLLPAFLAFRFTGRVLPWDSIGFEATRRGLQFLESVPVIGGWTATWLRGGEDMGSNTLSRFFTTHVLILPWIACGMIVIHLYLVARHGLKEGGK